MKQPTRGEFSRAAGLATALSYSRILGANDRLRMGFIGLGNRGDQVHDAFLEFGESQTTAICDLREDYMDLAARKSRGTPTRYRDYRKLLDDKNVDAGTRPQLSELREGEKSEDESRCADRASIDFRAADRQYRSPYESVSRVVRQGRTIYEQCGREPMAAVLLSFSL